MRLPALRTALVFITVILFAVFMYWDILSYRTFGSELPSFYSFHGGITFSQVLTAYRTHLTYPWYRPSTFDLFYWFGSLLFDWHNVQGWKILELSGGLLCSFLIYWLVLLLLPKQRLAAALAAIYFIASPNLYTVVLDTQGLDFIHIIFCLLCFILFLLAYRSTGWRAAVFLSLSILSYAMALTSKELTIVTPVYLTVAAGALLFAEGGKRRWGRTALELLPFFLLMGAYWVGHVQRMPKNTWEGNGGYRMQTYWPAIIANLKNYPFWMTRLYVDLVPDSQALMAHFNRWWSNLPAGLAVVAVVVVWFRNARREVALRLPLFLLLAWMAIFLIVPVYSGGFYWHANLAMAGYAVLFGYAIAYLFESIPVVAWRRAAVCVFVLGFFFLARANVWSFLHETSRFHLYRLNYMALDAPPLKPEQLAGPGRPLIYVEDRLGLSSYAYGQDNLFKFIYLNKDIEEKSVPALTSVPKPLCTEWLARPNAHFVSYDARYHWGDETELFRQYCKGKM
jgi:hypothetical protein